MTKLEKIADRMSKTRELLNKLEAEFNELRLAELRKVELVKNDRSYTLTFNGRKINAAYGTYGRLKVTENKKVIVPEFSGNVHDLRFDIALGNI